MQNEAGRGLDITELFGTKRLTAGPTIAVIGRRQLRHQSRYPVFHLGEGHGVNNLVGNAIVILSSEMRLSPKVVELDGMQGLGDLLRVEALSLLYRSDKGEGGIREVDARRIPLAVLLAIARLPTLDLLGQWLLDVPMHPRALDVRLAGDVRHHRGVDLPDVNEAPLEAELAGLLDDQADATGRRRVHADDVGFLGKHAEQDRVEVGDRAFEKLLRHHQIAEPFDKGRLDLNRPPAGVVVRRDPSPRS